MKENSSANSTANNTIDFFQIIGLLLSKIWIIILVVALFGASAFSISEFILPVKYSSSISMYVKNNTDANESVSYQDLSASQSLVSTYIVILSDKSVMNDIGSILLERHSLDEMKQYFSVDEENNIIKTGSLSECFAMAAVDNTEVLKITCTTTDAELSAELCNIIGEIAPEYLTRIVGAGDVQSIAPAEVINTPVSPNILKNTIIGMFAGFMIIVLIIIAVDFLDRTIRSGEDLQKRFEKPILGEIQFFDTSTDEEKKKKKNKKVHSTDIKRSTLLDKNIPFYVTESYKAMRTNIVFALAPYENRIIAVSSATPGDGKSTTSANIAIAIAQGGHRCLLCEADLRKPVDYKIFGLKNKVGLSTIISKQGDFEKCVHKNVIDNLDVLTAGPTPPNPSELLASETTKKLLVELSEKYDYVIVDTPPVNVVSDAFGMSDSIAGLLLVARHGVTTYDEVEVARKNIELANMNLLGFVFNGIKAQGGSYYNSKYNKYGYKKYGYKKYGYRKYGYGYKNYGYGYGYGHYGNTPAADTNNSSKSDESTKSDNSKSNKK